MFFPFTSKHKHFATLFPDDAYHASEKCFRLQSDNHNLYHPVLSMFISCVFEICCLLVMNSDLNLQYTDVYSFSHFSTTTQAQPMP